MPTAKKRRVKPPPPTTAEIAAALQRQQLIRVGLMKPRIAVMNQAESLVAGYLGYEGRLTASERKRKYAEAAAFIKSIRRGESRPDESEDRERLRRVVSAMLVGIETIRQDEVAALKAMRKWARLLPVAAWRKLPEQRGFGLESLAALIGETGDLSNYPNPDKVNKRMGCAPYQYGGRNLMGATWKSKRDGDARIKLPGEEWKAFGYSPRRRSVAFVIGTCLVKGNFLPDGSPGPYRARYLEAKAKVYQTHPEWRWKDCEACEGVGGDCPKCSGIGKKCARAHRHGMLLATKRLFRNLWIEWHGNPPHVKTWE